MKKLHKKIIGICGLALVAVMTFIATQLPAPGASAATTQVDTVTVRVVGDKAELGIVQPADGSKFNTSSIPLELTYANVYTVKMEITYTDPSTGMQTKSTVDIATPDYEPGSYNDILDLSQYGSGYGNYSLRLVAYDRNGVLLDEKNSLITFGPTSTSGGITDGAIIIDVDINNDKKVTSVTIDVYLDGKYLGSVELDVDENGNLIDGRYYSTPDSPYTFYVDVIDGKVILPDEIVKMFGPGDYEFVVHTTVDEDGDGTGDNTYDSEITVPVSEDDIKKDEEPDCEETGSCEPEPNNISGIKVNPDGSAEIAFDFSGVDNADQIAKIKLDIFKDGKIIDSVWIDVDGNGKLVPGWYDTVGGKRVYVDENGVLHIPKEVMQEWGNGHYSFQVTTYDKDDNIINSTIINTEIDDIPNTGGDPAGTPDTGSLFKNLNVSKEDFMITGLLVFFTVAGAGLIFVKKRHGAKTSFKRR